MGVPDLGGLADRELLALYAQVLDTLRARGTTRSSNNPVADYAEGLCAKALQLQLAGKAATGYDGTDASGHKIEIKARRLTKENGSRQLSAIRGIGHHHFDFLAGVLFEADFSVMKGCLIPYAVLKQHGHHNEHTNSHRFLLRDSVWSLPGVQDITEALKAAERSAATIHYRRKLNRSDAAECDSAVTDLRGPICRTGSAEVPFGGELRIALQE